MANYVHSKKEITLAGPRPARKPHRFFLIFYMKNLNRKRPNRKKETHLIQCALWVSWWLSSHLWATLDWTWSSPSRTWSTRSPFDQTIEFAGFRNLNTNKQNRASESSTKIGRTKSQNSSVVLWKFPTEGKWNGTLNTLTQTKHGWKWRN
jgi:hypothetical protein